MDSNKNHSAGFRINPAGTDFLPVTSRRQLRLYVAANTVAVNQALASPKGVRLKAAARANTSGKVITKAGHKVSDFATTPSAFSTIAYLVLCNDFAAVDRSLPVSAFLALAHGESNFDLFASSETSSARGPLQITKATYAVGLAQGLKSLGHGPKGLKQAIDTMYAAQTPADRRPWVAAAHADPSHDMSLGTVQYGLMYYYHTLITRNWTWLAGTQWVYHGKKTPNSVAFCAEYDFYLKDYNNGYQALITLMHTNGVNWLGNTTKSTLHYPDRINLDVTYHDIYQASASVHTLIAEFAKARPATKETGDPDPPGPVPKKKVTTSVPPLLAPPPDLPTLRDYRQSGRVIWDWNAIMGFRNILDDVSAKTKEISTSVKTKAVTITSGFGPRRSNKKAGMMHSFHKGLDLRAREGTTTYACANGVISLIQHYKNMGSWGNTLVLTCEDGDKVRYAHLSRIDVTLGEAVKLGEPIGATGHTGVIQSHLHIEYYPQGGAAVDPLKDPQKRYLQTL